MKSKLSLRLWSTSVTLLPLLVIFGQCSKSENVKSTGNWETLKTESSPTGRHENGFVEHNGLFYLFGGRGIKPVEVFNPETLTWTKKKTTPFEMHHFQAVAYKDAIYLIGCMTGRYPHEKPVTHIQKYYPEDDRWEEGAEIPEHRRRGSSGVVLYENKFYLIAGIQEGHTSGCVSWFDVFDPETGKWEELEDAPHVRDHFHAIVVGHKLYCVGGRNTSVHEPDNFTAFFAATVTEVDVYDFETGRWQTLENNLPVGTAAGGIAELDGFLYYAGGESDQKTAHSETQCLNLSTGEWSFASPLNRGRHGTAIIEHEGELYITAGSGNKGGSPELTSIEKFTPNSEWISLFNGNNLEGWQVFCLPEDQQKTYWSVKDNAITCNSMGDKDHNYVWLMSDVEMTDFEFLVKVKAFRDSPGNSGVQFRSRYDQTAGAPGGGWLDGPQVDIHPPNPFRTGLIYDETREEKRWIYPSLEDWKIDSSYAAPKWTFFYEDEGWNDLKIICKGTHVKTVLNGDIITNWDGSGVLDNQAHKKHNVGLSGKIAFQLHSRDELKIQFKNIKFRSH